MPILRYTFENHGYRVLGVTLTDTVQEVIRRIAHRIGIRAEEIKL